MSKKRIASILIGIVISIVVIALGFTLIQRVFTKAEDLAPRDVVVSDIAQDSVKLTWSTGQETQGVVEYGTSPTALNFFAPENKKTQQHSVDLTLLSPTSTYYFQVRIGDTKYDNGGVPWSFTTKGTAEQSPSLPSLTPAQTIINQEPSPTVVTSIEIPSNEQTIVCTETDCDKIKDNIGKGCQASDWTKCEKAKEASLSATPAP